MWIYHRWKELPTQELKWMIQAILNRRKGSKPAIIADHHHDLLKTLDAFTSLERIRINAWIKDRLISHKPLQYILRSQPFCGLDIHARPPTLIPRWETEEWTLKVIEILKSYIERQRPSQLRILDLCSGSGCISLALAHHLLQFPVKLQVIGIDNSLSAYKLASVNQRKLGISSDVLSFVRADIFKDLPVSGNFDLVVSNPPYISYDHMTDLDKDVLDWEDHSALFASDNGMKFYKRIIELLPLLVSTNSKSFVVLEVDGESQAQSVLNLVKHFKYSGSIWKDLAGRSRCIYLDNMQS